MKNKFMVFLLFCTYGICTYSQDFEGWLPEEIKYYNNLKRLAEYVNEKSEVDIGMDTTIQKFLKIEEASRDSINRNTVYSIEYRNGVFSNFVKGINKHGLENLDAKPLRFYKENDSLYRPFDRALKEVAPDFDPNVMVYFRKENPEKPLGTLLFDVETHKLISWVLLKGEGGSYFFLILMKLWRWFAETYILFKSF